MSSSSASWIYSLDCLDDIYQSYYQDEIDYDVFSMLVDLYDIGDLKPEDLQAVGAFEMNDPSIVSNISPDNRFWLNLLAPKKGKVGVRRYSRDFDRITGKFFFDIQPQGARLQAELRSNDGEYYWGKRAIFWAVGPLELTAGNYIVSEGFGLAIGRLDYRPSAGFSNDDFEFDFLYPTDSFYNGLKLDVKNGSFGERFYYSEKKYSSAKKIFIGSGVVFKKRGLTAGISAGLNNFDNLDVVDKRFTVGLNFKIENKLSSIAGEYASVEQSGGLFLKGLRWFDDMAISTEFWRYSDNFNNYNCSGPSATDYSSFYPGGQELGFRSAQAGETGLAVNLTRRYLSIGFQFWRQSYERQVKSSFNLRLFGRLKDNLSAVFQTVSMFKDQNSYLWLRTGFWQDERPLLKRCGFKLYFNENAKIIGNRSYSYIDFLYGLEGQLNIFLKLRNYSDGKARWFFGEELNLTNGININAEVVIFKGKKVNLKIEKLL